MLIRYSAFWQGVKYETSIAQGFLVCSVSVPTIVPRSRIASTRDAFMSRSTDASLVWADQCPSPKSRVRRSAAAMRTAAIAAASAGVTGEICEHFRRV